MRGNETCGRIVTNFCTGVGVHDVITSANFYDCRLWHLSVVMGSKFGFLHWLAPCECVISRRLHLPKTKWPNHLSRPYNTVLPACTCSKLQELKMPSVYLHSRFLPNHHVGYANGGLCLKVLEKSLNFFPRKSVWNLEQSFVRSEICVIVKVDG